MQELGVAYFNIMTSSAKRRRVGPDVEVTEEGVVEMLVMYDRREFPVDKTPKTSLYSHNMWVITNMCIYIYYMYNMLHTRIYIYIIY